MDAVREWLGTVGLGVYADAFESEGYDELELLQDLSTSDVDEIVQAVGMRAGHSANLKITIDPLCPCALAWR